MRPLSKGDTVNAMLPLSKIVPSPTNPRKTFEPQELQALADSIAEVGVIQPILVRPCGTDQYELVCGERRFRASRMAKQREIPAVIRVLSDEEVLVTQVVENSQRQDVPPLEELAGYEALMATGHWSVETIAAKLGRSERYVRERLRLRDLVPAMRTMLEEGRVPMSWAMVLARAKPEVQETFADNRIHMPSLQRLRDWVKGYFPILERAPFDQADETLVPVMGACATCAFRSSNSLFVEDREGDDRCTKPSCFDEKVQANIERLKARGVPVFEGWMELDAAGLTTLVPRSSIPDGASDSFREGAIECEAELLEDRPTRFEDLIEEEEVEEYTPEERAELLRGAQWAWDESKRRTGTTVVVRGEVRTAYEKLPEVESPSSHDAMAKAEADAADWRRAVLKRVLEEARTDLYDGLNQVQVKVLVEAVLCTDVRSGHVTEAKKFLGLKPKETFDLNDVWNMVPALIAGIFAELAGRAWSIDSEQRSERNQLFADLADAFGVEVPDPNAFEVEVSAHE